MSIAAIEKLIWVLIFGGMAVFGLGLSVGQNDTTLAWAFMLFGALLVLFGAVLVWFRSRMKGEGES